MCRIKTAKFKPNNKVRYGQDFCYFIGVPSGVKFKVEPFQDGRFKLVADGYVVLNKPNCYGNGALYTYDTKRKKAYDHS